MSTLHCKLENGADLAICIKRASEDTTLCARSTEEECQMAIFTSGGHCGVYVNLRYIAMLYSFDWKSAIEHDGGVYNT